MKGICQFTKRELISTVKHGKALILVGAILHNRFIVKLDSGGLVGWWVGGSVGLDS